jgi:hypothetical protein
MSQKFSHGASLPPEWLATLNAPNVPDILLASLPALSSTVWLLALCLFYFSVRAY